MYSSNNVICLYINLYIKQTQNCVLISNKGPEFLRSYFRFIGIIIIFSGRHVIPFGGKPPDPQTPVQEKFDSLLYVMF